MATLLPSLSSDEEDNLVDNESDQEEEDEVNRDFSFGGILVCTHEHNVAAANSGNGPNKSRLFFE